MAGVQRGRVVVVTGGASGIGRACVEHFLELDATVASIDLRTAGDSAVLECEADLTDQAQVDAALERIVAELGGVDVLVNNAGVSYVGGIEDGSEDDWFRLWNVNLMGYVRAIRAALPHLRRSAAPSVVNVSSTTATSGFRQRALYSATKGAIEAMTRSVAADLVAEGIPVNAVNPGTVDTPFMAELAAQAEDPVARRADFDARQPTGRMVSPREVALAVAYAAHPENRSMIGATLMVDGGIFPLHITRA